MAIVLQLEENLNSTRADVTHDLSMKINLEEAGFVFCFCFFLRWRGLNRLLRKEHKQLLLPNNENYRQPCGQLRGFSICLKAADGVISQAIARP